ncbi:MAG: hypothetical protein OXL38_13320 [Gammaproteobacteria bacterium]|nr:hypothetical protein [Gammaproteobacteria bacterium]
MTRMLDSTPASAITEVQAAIQQQLSTHGFYSPVELLLATNRLGYDDYRAWRRGDRRTLDALLRDGVEEARTFLEEADAWVRGLHLEAEAAALLGTDKHAGVELKASANPGLDNLLHVEYRRDVDRAQPDLFLDGAQAQVQNQLIEAITARDAAVSGVKLRQLATLDAGHWAIDHAVALIDALQAAPLEQPKEARQRLDAIENRWLPAASSLLRAGARDFLSPLWRDVGRALEGVPFASGDAKGHASWAYLNGLDWSSVKRTILEEHWESEPLLQTWLARARWRLAEYREAMRLWFALCWHFPAHFAECVESSTFPNSSLQRAWEEAQDQDLDPPITPPWFPAWLLIGHPGIARTIGPCGGTSGPERAFDHLVALRRGISDREDLDHRRALHDIHPDLLGRYLASLDD